MLYERDYNFLTDEEIRLWKKAEEILHRPKNKTISIQTLKKYYEVIPKAALHHCAFFPNNFLDAGDLEDKKKIEAEIGKLTTLLDTNPNERAILNFVKDERSPFLIGAIFHYGPLRFNFGHHQAFLFREFPLGTNYVADYLLIGKNSGGYEFIFIEFENPSQGSIINGGEFGLAIRKGITQINEWKSWLTANYGSLQAEFEKYLGPRERNLPPEFYKLDVNRLHYVVVAGRRSDYNERTYALRRTLLRENHITLLHYDNLLDSIKRLLSTNNY